MSQPLTPPRSIAITSHPNIPQATEEGKLVAAFLQERGLHVVEGDIYDEPVRRRIQEGEFDMVITLGGDGTMLRAGHLCAPIGIPLLGINLGHFGFLYEVQRDEWRTYLPQLLAGHFRLEKRMMLNSEMLRGGQVQGAWPVMNDVFVGRGLSVRPVTLTAHVDGYLMTAYVADGLIAATATGSTAYSLAAGGPILPPETRTIIIVPVAPHLSLDRAVVLPESVVVTLTVNTSHQAVMSVDGQAPVSLEDGDQVLITASNSTLCLVRFQDPSYFYRNLTHHMEQNPLTGVRR